MSAEPTPESNKTKSKAGLIARSTLIISAGWGASIIVGLLRQRIIAGQFGTSAVLDAFFFFYLVT